MDPEPFRDKPVLTGARVELRPFAAADVDAMARILADPDVLRLTGSVHSTEAAHAESGEADDTLRHWYSTRNDQADRLDLAIIDRDRQRLVGEVVLNELDADDDTCNLRILIGPEGRDRGLGSEAIRLVLAHAFATTDLHRIELSVFAFNPRARHVYERIGFVVEGVRREALRYDGERVDDVLMSILRPDWERSRSEDGARP